MRVALFSDIHGNDVALAAVVADIELGGADSLICLGDAVQGGPQPVETIARLRALGCPVVLGNSDDFLLEVPAESAEPITEAHLAVREWALSQLGEDDLAFIRSMPPTIARDGLLAFHASPRSHEDVLLPWSEPEALEPFLGTDAEILAGGHTHVQWTRRIGDALFVNPGSVGLPYDHHQPEDDLEFVAVAQWALFVDGAVEFRRVSFSLDDLVAAAREHGHPDAATYGDRWRRVQ